MLLYCSLLVISSFTHSTVKGDECCQKWSELGLSERPGQEAEDHMPIRCSGITLSALESLEDVHLAHRPSSPQSGLSLRSASLSQVCQQAQETLLQHASSSLTTTSTESAKNFTSPFLLGKEESNSPDLIPLARDYRAAFNESLPLETMATSEDPV